MKTIVSLVVAFALALSAMPAVAGDTFQAFSKMATDEQPLLTPLADYELEVIEAGFCIACANIARVRQTNVNAVALNTLQANVSTVTQVNR